MPLTFTTNRNSPISFQNFDASSLQGEGFLSVTKDFGAVGDGVTDDTTAFATAAEAQQPVFVPPPDDAYLIGAIQPSSSNGGFFGLGASSVIRAQSGLSADLFTIQGRDNWTLRNLKIDMNSVSTHIGVKFQNCTNVDVDGLLILNWDQFAISLGICDEWKIRNCIIKRASAINTQNQAINVYSVSQPTTRGLVANNICENSGIDLSCSDTIIRNNIVSSWKFGGGITTEQDTSCYNLNISGNVCHGSRGTDSNGVVVLGIESWAANSIISNNICYDNAGDGIDVGGKNSTVIGNVCYGNGQTSVSPGIVARYGSSTYNASGSVFAGNKCYDGGSTKQTYGYGEESASLSGIVLSGNNFDNNNTGPYNILSTSTVIDNSNAPNTQTGASYSVVASDRSIIANRAGTVTLTLLSAALYPSRQLTVKTIQAQTVVSASSNVVPLVGGSAGTAILAGTAGKWATLESDGTNWVIVAGN